MRWEGGIPCHCNPDQSERIPAMFGVFSASRLGLGNFLRVVDRGREQYGMSSLYRQLHLNTNEKEEDAQLCMNVHCTYSTWPHSVIIKG
jgi:hypothetical protein